MTLMSNEDKKKPTSKKKLIYRSIGFKIAAAIAALNILICSVLGIIAYTSASKTLNENIRNFLQSRAIDNAAMVTEKVEDYITEIEGVATRPDVISMDWEIQNPALTSEAKRMGYKKFGVIDTTGNAIFTDGETVNVKGQEYFTKALQVPPM